MLTYSAPTHTMEAGGASSGSSDEGSSGEAHTLGVALSTPLHAAPGSTATKRRFHADEQPPSHTTAAASIPPFAFALPPAVSEAPSLRLQQQSFVPFLQLPVSVDAQPHVCRSPSVSNRSSLSLVLLALLFCCAVQGVRPLLCLVLLWVFTSHVARGLLALDDPWHGGGCVGVGGFVLWVGLASGLAALTLAIQPLVSPHPAPSTATAASPSSAARSLAAANVAVAAGNGRARMPGRAMAHAACEAVLSATPWVGALASVFACVAILVPFSSSPSSSSLPSSSSSALVSSSSSASDLLPSVPLPSCWHDQALREWALLDALAIGVCCALRVCYAFIRHPTVVRALKTASATPSSATASATATSANAGSPLMSGMSGGSNLSSSRAEQVQRLLRSLAGALIASRMHLRKYGRVWICAVATTFILAEIATRHSYRQGQILRAPIPSDPASEALNRMLTFLRLCLSFPRVCVCGFRFVSHVPLVILGSSVCLCRVV